mgnify:CR=1 FL=1
MQAADSFDSAANYLDSRLRAALVGVDSRVKESAYEIRLRSARPVVIVTRGGSLFVYGSGRTGEVYSPGALTASPAELQASFSRMCGYSVHSNSAAAASGFISLAHGHRAGVCGTAVMAENGTVRAFRDISSVNLRIAHEVRGAADEIYTRLFNNGAVSAIIAGPPLSGKTTLLRDLARRLSGPSGGNFFRVAVVDERGEIAASSGGCPQCDVGFSGLPQGCRHIDRPENALTADDYLRRDRQSVRSEAYFGGNELRGELSCQRPCRQKRGLAPPSRRVGAYLVRRVFKACHARRSPRRD